MWGTGELQHVVNPDMPWNEEIRAAWARLERLAASPRTLALVRPLLSGLDVGGGRPTLSIGTPQAGNEGARRARRRAIAAVDAPTHTWRYRLKEAAK